MLMSLTELIDTYSMKITGVLHVGAHLAEEAPEYHRLGIDNVWWVEGNPGVIPTVERNVVAFGHHVIQGLVYSRAGEDLPFNITNYDGMSSSILEFGTHPQFSPDTVFVDQLTLPTTTIDKIAREWNVEANFLNMDLQGAELHALRGAPEFLRDVDYVMTEVNSDEVYKNCAKIEELDSHLANFRRVETYWVPEQGWGDALYVRSAK